jgi:hypothetical protein
VSEEFDPAWEYFAGDPEVEEFLAERAGRVPNHAKLIDPRYAGHGDGLRYDAGQCGFLVHRPGSAPKTFLGRERPVREYESACRRLACAWCGVPFVEHRPLTGRYCSVACAAARRAASRRVRPRSLACGQCGESFEPVKVGQTLCSLKCFGAKIRRPTFAQGCPTCGGEIPPQAVRRGMPKKYCSRACMHTMVKRRYSRKK